MKKTKIEWCDSTWNPVTGCFHGCEYCYARRIAERFGRDFAPRLGDPGMEGACKYDSDEAGMDTMLELQKPYTDTNGKTWAYPMAFMPTFHRYRLTEPSRWTKPRTIFVCSMADLFGDWVPDEWIAGVFDACRAAPQHRYLFLSKNPRRYLELSENGLLPGEENFWFGSTVTGAGDKSMWCKNKGFHSFVSIEPILESVHLPEDEHCPEWVIVGAETGNRKDRVVPETHWLYDLQMECDETSIPMFMKESLVPIVGEENMRREFPWTSAQNDSAD